MRNQHVISDWYDGDLIPGTEWEPDILDHLRTARILLLLLSAHFMTSSFCQDIEMQEAIARHQAKQARVIPILLRPTDWQDAPFAKLQVLPSHAKPVSRWPNAGIYLYDRGQYQEAALLYEYALSIQERIYGRDHPNTSPLLNNLANLYSEQGKYEEAASLYQSSLASCEKRYGPEHPETASTLNNLAGLYYFQGKYDEAAPLYLRALAIREKVFGPDHPIFCSSSGELHRTTAENGTENRSGGSRRLRPAAKTSHAPGYFSHLSFSPEERLPKAYRSHGWQARLSVITPSLAWHWQLW